MLPSLIVIIAENFRNQRRISFTVSASVAAEAHTTRAGGGENTHGWKKVRSFDPGLDMLPPAE